MNLKKAPGLNEHQGTEDFEINARRGSHSGKYGTTCYTFQHATYNYI